MRYALALIGLAAIVFSSALFVRGEDKPAAKTPESKPAISIGEMRIQTVPALTYLYTEAETSFEKMGEPVKEGFDKVFYTASEAKMLLARPTMLVYQGGPHFDPKKTFKMEIGVIVADDTKASGEIKLRKTEPFKCATILYTGPVMEQGQAYQKLIPALTAAGLTPTGEEREMCLFWEGPESVNNIFWMQIGIK